MLTLEEQLRNTLNNLNERRSQAGGNLNRTVAQVATAVSTISGGLLQLKLRRVAIVANHLNYDLILTYRGKNSQPIARYEVPLSGYPIESLPPANGVAHAKLATIASPAELAEHFATRTRSEPRRTPPLCRRPRPCTSAVRSFAIGSQKNFPGLVSTGELSRRSIK
jgi:hypothetical protein